MAHAKLDMEDSDSEYDPSKIPANPPKAATRPPSAHQSEGQVLSSTVPPDSLVDEARKDWAVIDHVCSKPMFAQTQEVEKALDLVRKWSDGAEARYGAEIMAYLRRKVIGPAVEARKTELQRILSLRQQANPDKPMDSTAAQFPQPNTLPPMQQRVGELSPPQKMYPLPDQRALPALSRPLPYNGTASKTPSQLSAPQTKLPPMQVEPQRSNSLQQPAHQSITYPPQSFIPVSRGRNWIYSSESELWCPACRCGPLSCMHSHRLIGRLFTRGIKLCALEELHYIHDQLQNWAYKGHPLKMEPAMTKMYSLEELAAEQKAWVAELRFILNQIPPYQPQAPTREPYLPRPPQQQQTFPHPGGSQQSTPSIRSGSFSESRIDDRQPNGHSTAYASDAYLKGTPRSFTYSTPTSMRSPAALPPRVFEQGVCNMCPRNGVCIHQRNDKRPSSLPDRSPKQSHSDHKRKRSGTLDERRVKMAFRQQSGDSVSSDDDEEDTQGFLPAYPEQSYQKFNQIRTMVESMPKDQLSTAILRMCYSNSIILNWMKKELKKPEMPREIVVTGEASLITPTSPESPMAKQTVSSPEQIHAKRTLNCSKCQSAFDSDSEVQNGDCQWHDGDLIQNGRTVTPSGRIWQDDSSADRVWTCCGGEMAAKGCRSGKHSTKAPIKASAKCPDRSTVATLTNTAAGRPSVRQHNDSYSGDVSLYPGHLLVKALVDAEKKSERDTLRTLPSLRRLSLAANDNDYRSFQDFSPSLKTLDDIPVAAFELDIKNQNTLDLTTDPQQSLLHVSEIRLASQLHLTCAAYLCEKRRIFQAVVEAMQDGSEFTHQNAQAICRIEQNKSSILYSVFERIGWFEPKHFMKYLNDPSGTMVDSIEKSLPGIHDLPLSGANDAGRPNSAPDASGQLHVLSRRASSGSASAPVMSAHQIEERLRKQRNPVHLPHASSLFQPLHPPSHLHAPLFMNGHTDQGHHNTINLTDLQLSPPRDLIMAGSPETYQWRKNGSGKKMQVPICPYPRSWAEADAVDRELVRLKRHEGKQWEELFEWWRGKGRASLKNASCLAVRYSILKKNYEADWVREGL